MKLQLRSRGRGRAAGPVRSAKGGGRGNAPPETAGQNRAALAQALGRPVQTKLAVGRTDDPQEAQADRVAAQVMSDTAPGAITGDSAPSIRRSCPACEEESEKVQRAPAGPEQESEEEKRKKREMIEQAPAVQRKGEGATDAGGAMPAATSAKIGASVGGGAALPAGERSFFEPRFGARFSNVRVHADGESAQLAHSINARAFTIGTDVFFGAGQYRPGTYEGRRLMAHELTHTLQQSGSEPTIQRMPSSDDMDMAAEREYSEGGAPKANKCGAPSWCPPGFCDPYQHEKLARYYLAKDRGWILAGISLAVDSKVAKLWSQHLSGGAAPQDLTGDFHADFEKSKSTKKTTAFLVDAIKNHLTKSPPPVSDTVPVWVATLKSLIPGAIAELDDPTSKNQMNFNIPRDIPGNLAGGIGKDQLSCKTGALPSPFNDERIADGVVTAIQDPKTKNVEVYIVINYTVKDTVDLCPGDCGTTAEQIATVPISQFEATGIAGDVPFTVNFTVAPGSFTLPGKKP